MDPTIQLIIGKLPDLFVGAAIAIVTAIITVFLSSRRFRFEKMWERKEHAYSEIIDGLQSTKHFFTLELEAMEESRELPKGRREELKAKAEESEEQVRKATDTGMFLISGEAVRTLQEYRRKSDEAWTENDWYSFVVEKQSVVSKCLEKMIVLARRDLGIATFRERYWDLLFNRPKPRKPEKKIKAQ